MFDRFRRRVSHLPSDGWPPGPSSPVDLLADDDLALINSMLPWRAFTVDGRGRRLGNRAWSGKRDEPQTIPDRRIVLMDEQFGLRGRSVLELGCFEGVHTIGLSQAGADVIALDSRVENVAKTAVRTGLYGATPELVVRDLEQPGSLAGLDADLAHHVGVLYHLDDPVRHLVELGSVIREGLMLDTHVAGSSTTSYTSGERRFEFAPYTEGGRSDAFSGMKPQAKWLTLPSLRDALDMAGFPTIQVVEERAERNGPRVLLFASR